MRDVDLAYIAGMLDGEGCISLSSRNKVKGYTHVVIEINNRYRPVLDWIAAVIGKGKVYQKKCKYGYSYTYCLYSKDGQEILPLLRPYLKIKQTHADLLFAYWDLVNKYPLRDPFRKETIDDMIQTFRRINKRGKRD